MLDIAEETARAYAAFGAGRLQEAAQRAARVLREAPDDPGASTLIGRLALARGEPDVALHVFEPLAERYPNVAAVWLDRALALRMLGMAMPAIDAARRSLEIAPTLIGWNTLGELQLSLNRPRDAANAFRAALRIAPEDPAALRGLSLCENIEADEAFMDRIIRLAQSPDAEPRGAALLHYSLAGIFRRLGRRDQFLQHLSSANRLQRTLSSHGREAYDAVFDGLEAIFSRENLQRSHLARAVEPTPLFVLGMPRSGTTLIEVMLAGHPEVGSAGEVDYIRGPLRRTWEQRHQAPFPAGFDRLSVDQLTDLARAYTRRLALGQPGVRYVTDKTPGNYHVLGLLTILFPHSPIVHVVRDPMDTCFSILQHPFEDQSPHTCDMHLLAHVYRRYQDLMRLWQDLVGERFITVRYEDLVASPAQEGRRLFDFCGLTWDDSYVNVQNFKGPVRTFSLNQVREPIHRRGVGAWRPYASYLAPLQEGLKG